MLRSWVVAELKKYEEHRDYFESGGVVLDSWKGEVYTRIDIYKRLLTEGFHDDNPCVCRPNPRVAPGCTCRPNPRNAASSPYKPAVNPRPFTPPHGIRREGY